MEPDSKTPIRFIHAASVPMVIKQERQTRRVAVYCRVSTLAEAQEESFETQRDYYTRLIYADPLLELAGVYGDRGISGASTKRRPEFQRMIQDCKDGKVDMVMTKSISRFARNLADCMETIRELRIHGIPVVFERENIDTMSKDGEMLLAVLASIAQEEINGMSQNIRWSQEHHNAIGDPCRSAGYGYNMIIKNGKHIWSINQKEARRVQYAFRKACEGCKYWQILEGLDEIEKEEGTGIIWYYERLYSVLKNEMYIGDLLTNKKVTLDYLQKKSIRNTGQRHQYYIEGHHEPLVSREQFAIVQERIKNREMKADYCELPEHRRRPVDVKRWPIRKKVEEKYGKDN